MNTELQGYLDGELTLADLSPEDRVEAERWLALIAEAEARLHARAPDWLETRIMARLPAEPDRSGFRAAIAWLTSPRPVRIRPITVGLAGAAAALLLFLARPEQRPVVPAALPSDSNLRAVTSSQPAVVYVQFVLANPAATTVTVAGDFNSWDVTATPLTDTDGDGVWTGHVALRPGLHKYMFVVDGEEWVTDPQADTYVDDGFGMRNAVVTVAQPGRVI